MTDFKNEVEEWFTSNKSDICGDCGKSEFLQFIFDFKAVSLSKDDFQKRKRVKNSVPQQNRCCAKRANSEQCTRRKKDDLEYCGTHSKGTPYGEIEYNATIIPTDTIKHIRVQDIKGIQYFIDDENNIYDHGDILANKTDPKVLTQYVKHSENSYSIPEYGL